MKYFSTHFVALIFIIILIFGITGESHAESKCLGQYCLEDKIYLYGEQLKALSIAAEDFQRHLHSHYGNKKTNLKEFLVNLENYLIFIEIKKDGNYSIMFHPQNFLGQPIKGGGAIYEISSNNYKILLREYTM